MDVFYHGENCLSISFFNFENFGCKNWGLVKKSSNYGWRERKYADTGGGGGHARGQESLQIHFFVILSL